MKNISPLQKIEDYYYQQGLRGNKLRKAVSADKDYMESLNKRRSTLTKKFSIKLKDKKRYVLSTDDDYVILDMIYQLEQKNISKSDRASVKLIRTQLEHDWRIPIIRFLNRLIKKYR